ncbi:MAG: hypothetical protein RL150_112 [Candidatus Parcubacteria bacterium]|jgi:hypothetical protein
MKYRLYIGALVTVALSLALVAVPNTTYAATCSFTRDLDLNIDGEDVRCLQKYLNGAGYKIAASGVGSPGNETSLYRQLTKDAVAKWQAANGLTASGYFGPQSRALYNKLVSGVVSSGNSSAPSTTGQYGGLNASEVQAFLAKLNGTSSGNSSTATTNANKQSEAQQRLKKAIDEVRNEDDFEEEDVRDALVTLLDAMKAYLSGSYNDASADALEAYEKLDGKAVNQDELDDDIKDAKEALDDARDDVADAEDDDKDVDDAEDLLDDAEDKLDDAEKAYDDKDYKDAREYLNDAEELIADALDEIGVDREDEADQAIEDAEQAIDDAKDAIEKADDDGEDVDSAEKLLDAAEERLDDAKDSFDDDEWENAIEDAEDAEDLAKDAVDELD